MDARRTPQAIFSDHLQDQVTDFFGKSLPAAHCPSGFAQRGPVPSESSAVPADNCLGHIEKERLFPLRLESASDDPKDLVEQTEFWFWVSRFQHDKLLSKSQVLEKQILSVAKDAKDCSEPQAKKFEHGGRVIVDEILACTPMLLISTPDRIVARGRASFRLTNSPGECKVLRQGSFALGNESCVCGRSAGSTIKTKDVEFIFCAASPIPLGGL